KAEKTLEAVERYLKDHAQDEGLISGLAGIEQQLGNLLARQQEITQKETDLKQADTAVADASIKLETASRQCSLNKQALEEAGKKLEQGKDRLIDLLADKLLREYRSEKEALLREEAFLMKIAELESHRAKLEGGKPCPLCGATAHPFAAGNIPAPDKIEQKIESLTRLIDKAENQEAVIRKLEQVETTTRKNLHRSEKLEAEAINNRKAAEKTLAELKVALSELRAGFEKLKLSVSGKLQPLGITEIPETEVAALLESLKTRLKIWQAQAKQKAVIEKEITDVDSEIKRLDAVIDTQLKALTEKQENLQQLKKELADGTGERKQLYGDKKPDEEEHHLNTAIARAETAEKQARSLNTGLQQKLTSAKARVESLQKRIEQRAPELKEAETDFSTALSPAGFADEASFLAARLPHIERESLSARAKDLDHAETELKAKQKDRETRLTTEIAKKLTDKTLEDLEPQFKGHEEALKQLRDAIAGLKHKLHENTAARERIKEKKSAIEAQKKEFRRWNNLHALIGSADGKKYRNFAQGLTFDMMIGHANRQLQKMTDRYLLAHDDTRPLELNVV
ncbi:MAG: chromosome segregation protein SMC, partial [Mariprofundaceae bacterium]